MREIVAFGGTKKAYKADLELRRAEMFLVALVVVLSSIYSTLEWNAGPGLDDDLCASRIDDIIDDIEFNPDLFMPANSPAVEGVEGRPTIRPTTGPDGMKVMALSDEVLTPRSGKDANLSDPIPAITIDPLIRSGGNGMPASGLGMPEFPGGATALMKWITANLKYPSSAGTKQGRAVARFIVDAEGNITDLKVEESTSPQFEHSVMRTMRKMPRWTPGTENGNPCPWMVALPIYFNP